VSNGSILVTGGAGYIGSHVVRQLGEAAERIVVLDTLGRGFRQAVTAGELVVGDVGDQALVSRLLADHRVDTVMHFAAHTIVPESVAHPLKYYGNNTCATRALLQACLDNNVKHFVFSSTAAVYGMPDQGYADEGSPTRPINAYGSSKLMSEWMLRDVAASSDLRYVALRYFNVAGSDPGGRIGQATQGATLLTKVACEAMVGKRPHVAVFGSDYPTPDGTGMRDYLHVEDLAAAHLNALDYLRGNGNSVTLNVGYGHGYSVREVLRMVETVGGRPLVIREEARRPGDPAYLVARADRIRTELGWQPRYDDLEAIVTHSLAWERKLLQEPWS
jgi:UDP-glucose 4-epimerase